MYRYIYIYIVYVYIYIYIYIYITYIVEHMVGLPLQRRLVVEVLAPGRDRGHPRGRHGRRGPLSPGRPRRRGPRQDVRPRRPSRTAGLNQADLDRQALARRPRRLALPAARQVASPGGLDGWLCQLPGLLLACRNVCRGSRVWL